MSSRDARAQETAPRWAVVIECVDEDQARAYAAVRPGRSLQLCRDGVRQEVLEIRCELEELESAVADLGERCSTLLERDEARLKDWERSLLNDYRHRLSAIGELKARFAALDASGS